MTRVLTVGLIALVLLGLVLYAGAAPQQKYYWGIEYESSPGVWEWAYHAWVHNDPTIPPDIYRLYRNRPAARKCIRKHAEVNHPGVAFRAFETRAPIPRD